MYGGGSFCLAAKVLDDDNMQPSGEIFAIPHQHYQSGYQFTFSSLENNGANLQRNKEFGSTTILRKRSNEDSSSLSERGITSLIENINEQEKNKRRKAASSLQQWHHQVQETSNFQVQKVPTRRSQKLSDKITALQKLVSPYGKTDTASVLQEASLYIKLLQQQIKNLYQMLNKSTPSQKFDGKQLDIQSRGLCLVPISVLQKWTQLDQCCFAISNTYTINPIISRDV